MGGHKVDYPLFIHYFMKKGKKKSAYLFHLVFSYLDILDQGAVMTSDRETKHLSTGGTLYSRLVQ